MRQGVLENMVEKLLGGMKSVVHGEKDVMDDTLRKKSVLSKEFGTGMRWRDLNLP